MRMSNASRLFFAASVVFVSVFMAGQNADAGVSGVARDRLFALGREPGGAAGTTLLDVTNLTPFAPVTIGSQTAGAFFSGLAFQPGTETLFVSTGSKGTTDGTFDANSLFTMDPSTGVPTLVGPTGLTGAAGVENIQDIIFDAAGVLYGNDNEQLYTIDPVTAVATATSVPFHDGSFDDIRLNAMAIDPTTGIHYGISWDDSELFTIDTSTGAATSVGVFDALETAIGAVGIGGLDFDSSGNLYVSTGSESGDIFALDITDANSISTVATLLGNAGDTLAATTGDVGSVSALRFGPAATAGPVSDADGDGDVDGADFLALQRSGGDIAAWQAEFGTGVPSVAAISAVPEPSALALLVLGAIGLGSLRGRKS